MNKPEKISLASAGWVVAIASLLAFFAAMVAFAIYVANMDLRTMFSPASSPAYAFMSRGYTVSFALAAVAMLLAIAAAIREAREPKTDESLRNKKRTTSALVISAVMLFATIVNGALPLSGITKPKAMTPTAKVARILKDDVAVTFKAYDEKSGALPVTVTNKRPGATDYIIIVDALDKAGHRMAQDSIYTTDMKGRGTQDYTIFRSRYTNAKPSQLKTATFKINDITVIDRAQAH